MEQIALQYGYFGLFVMSFVAATLIAAPSDVVAMSMPQFGYNPVWVALVATLGGYLGNLVNYGVGKYGAAFVLARFFPDTVSNSNNEDDESDNRWMGRAQRLYERYGVWSLLLSGTPFIGDPLTTVAGAFNVNLLTFSALVLVGKVAKFALLLGAVDVVANLLA